MAADEKCCNALGKGAMREAKALLTASLDSQERSIGGSKCCPGNGKTCPLCGAKVKLAWLSHRGARVGYHACSNGHKVRIG
jgi:hypothetical protein